MARSTHKSGAVTRGILDEQIRSDLRKKIENKFRELNASGSLSDAQVGRILDDKFILELERIGDIKPQIELKPIPAKDLSRAIGGFKLENLQKLKLQSGVERIAVEIQKDFADFLPRARLEEGVAGATIPFPLDTFITLVNLAAIELVGGNKQVVWDDGLNRIVVDAGDIRVKPDGQFLSFHLRLHASKSVRFEVTVPYALADGKNSKNLVLATAKAPFGDAKIVSIWGEAIIALTYGAFGRALTSFCEQIGEDQAGNGLIPVAVWLDKKTLMIETAARHSVRDRATAVKS